MIGAMLYSHPLYTHLLHLQRARRRRLTPGRSIFTVLPAFFLIISFSVGASALFAVDVDLDKSELSRPYMLYYLLAEDVNQLDREIVALKRKLEQTEEEAHTEKNRQKLYKLRYALASLLNFHYTRTDLKTDAFDAKNLLESIKPHYKDSFTYRVHLGMAHSFIAKIRTVFGLSNLEEMQKQMKSIPENHNDWLVRFLRGSTLLRVGSALPGIFSIKEIKLEALRIGKTDLHYLLDQYRENSIDSFDPGAYDKKTMPVPLTIAEQSKKILQEVE